MVLPSMCLCLFNPISIKPQRLTTTDQLLSIAMNAMDRDAVVLQQEDWIDGNISP